MRFAEARGRLEHEQQFDQVVVHRRAGGLDDEDIAAADVLRDLDLHLAVAEATHLGRTAGDAKVGAHRVGKAGFELPANTLISSFTLPSP